MSEADPKETPLPVQIHAQYVRDISFENPIAPDSLRRGLPPPKTRVEFSMESRQLEGADYKGMYEVILSVRAEAHRDSKTVFIAEVQYGTVAAIAEMPDAHKHRLLHVEIPRLAFPFVRQILQDLSVSGGYPPLLLQPVNFHALYMERFGSKAGAQQQAPAPVKAEAKKDDKKNKRDKKKKTRH